ncbi:MAG: hypothetical protein GY853_07220 [PVC group bacterium]|nr:hypothetical protein [PVC group bacterium]
MLNKFGLYIFLITLVILLSISSCFAAEGGTRPISMGGAFVAMADDAHAATWNPAGMAWQEDFELSYSAILTNRDKYISGDFITDDYFVICSPLKSGYKQNFESRGAFGIYYQTSGYQQNSTDTSITQPGISYARTMFEDNFAIGIGASYYDFEVGIPGASDNDTALSYNLGFLWYLNDKITLGCLWENLNEPSYSILGLDNRLTRIWRPGVAYYFDEDTVVSLDIYDLTGNTEDKGSDFSQDIRIGFEHYMKEDFSIRFGAHHPNSSVDSSKYYSFGMGWQRSDFLGMYAVNYYLDYGFIYWTDVPAGMEDYIHQLGVTLKF